MKVVFRSQKIAYIMIVVTYGVWKIMKILRLHGTSGGHPKGGCWAAGPYPPPQLQPIETKKNICWSKLGE
jgi:hypothetical protein